MKTEITSWPQFVQWLFYGLLAAFGSVISAFLFNIQVCMKEMSASIIELNQNMAVMVTTTKFQEMQIQSHDDRLQRLERR